MRIVIAKCPDGVAECASQIFIKRLSQERQTVLGLATGSTPVSLYNKLIAAHKKGAFTFKDAVTFNLDEYLGLPEGHAQSYRYFMDDHLFSHVDIDRSRTFLPPSQSDDVEIACKNYEGLISEFGGIDLQLLGIGNNGHIGFNEPFSNLSSRTRVEKLTEETLAQNAHFFETEEFQPHLAITMGIATIMDSRQIVLLATGENKAEAVSKAIEGSITPACPASILQMHANITFIVDEPAAILLKKRNCYEYT